MQIFYSRQSAARNAQTGPVFASFRSFQLADLARLGRIHARAREKRLLHRGDPRVRCHVWMGRADDDPPMARWASAYRRPSRCCWWPARHHDVAETAGERCFRPERSQAQRQAVIRHGSDCRAGTGDCAPAVSPLQASPPGWRAGSSALPVRWRPQGQQHGPNPDNASWLCLAAICAAPDLRLPGGIAAPAGGKAVTEGHHQHPAARHRTWGGQKRRTQGDRAP